MVLKIYWWEKKARQANRFIMTWKIFTDKAKKGSSEEADIWRLPKIKNVFSYK